MTHCFKKLTCLILYTLICSILSTAALCSANDQAHPNFFDLSAKSALGVPIDFSTYSDNVVLVVNIATRCGTTPQLNDLERLYLKFKDHKFIVLGFPSEDFSATQFDSDQKVQAFCAHKYGITFPIFASAAVKGANAQPVFNFLTKKCASELQSDVGFNFEKILVGRDGQVKKRYGAFTGAMSSRVLADIEQELKK